jgi:transposase InsO family protein
VATIHRILVRRGLVVAQPAKRPRSAWKRFEWPRPNDVWQIDATSWALMDGTEVWIMDALDDHSRLVVAARVWPGPTAAAAWDALCAGAERWGLPARVLSDNGRCFTARWLHFAGECDFERDLRALGIAQMLSSPGHPQTCGKIERFHQTLKNWLRRQPGAADVDELQAQLEVFLPFYNYDRPHRALNGRTPAERWAGSARARPAEPIEVAPDAELRTVDDCGRFAWRGRSISVGRQLAGRTLVVVARDNNVAAFNREGLVRRLTLDPDRRSHPTGRPPGRPRKPKP